MVDRHEKKIYFIIFISDKRLSSFFTSLNFTSFLLLFFSFFPTFFVLILSYLSGTCTFFFADLSFLFWTFRSGTFFQVRDVRAPLLRTRLRIDLKQVQHWIDCWDLSTLPSHTGQCLNFRCQTGGGNVVVKRFVGFHTSSSNSFHVFGWDGLVFSMASTKIRAISERFPSASEDSFKTTFFSFSRDSKHFWTKQLINSFSSANFALIYEKWLWPLEYPFNNTTPCTSNYVWENWFPVHVPRVVLRQGRMTPCTSNCVRARWLVSEKNALYRHAWLLKSK